MFAGFAGDAGYAGPLGVAPSVQAKGYCLLGGKDVHQSAATACIFDGTLTSHPDENPAELICRGYEDKGIAFFSELSGPFLLCLIDEASDTTYVMRSNEELRPLYWQRSREKTMRHPFAFAESLRTWGRLNRRAWRLDRTGLSAFLHLGFFPDFFTPIQGVDRLLPGYLLRRDKRGFTLTQIKEESRPGESPTVEKAPSLKKTFRLMDLASQVWQLDIPCAALFTPALYETPLKLALPKVTDERPDSIYYNAKTTRALKILSRIFQSGTRPFMHPFWLSRRIKKRLELFERHTSLFTLAELQTIAPRVSRRFHFPAFTTKIIQRHTHPATFLDYEAIHMANAFDAKAKETISYAPLLAKESDFEAYIPDEALPTLLTFLENGALSDMDILHKEALGPACLTKKQLWSLAQLEMWLKLFYEGPPTDEHRRRVESALLIGEAASLL